MNAVSLTVNGKPVHAAIEPRTHLADFLRETQGLTGTHIGCEHGICGACTLLLDDAPVRGCITFAADCQDRAVKTIEGLEHDTVVERLRAAFTREHALQCGYCTPGMLVTARDIVMRLPDADDARIRLELAGNLCRCTGYQGIVRAIRLVLDERLEIARPAVRALPIGQFPTPSHSKSPSPLRGRGIQDGGSQGLTLSLQIAAPPTTVWRALRDPGLIASCVPGARLTKVEGGRIEGELTASLGPIRGKFTGRAELAYDDAGQAGTAKGQGRDQASGTNLTAGAAFRILADGDDATTLELEITYSLRGALAQFGRGPVVRVFAAEIAQMMGRNLEAALRGEQLLTRAQSLNTIRISVRLVWRWLRSLISGRT